MGYGTRDDAAVYRMGEELALIQTVDFFPPIVDDPYWYGAIAVANSLSDVYAMGGRPLLAMNILCWPADVDKAILGRVLQGGHEKAQEAGVLIVGGHSIDDEEPKYGLSVTGVVKPGQQVANSAAQPGDALVLTKPIGTGIITTAGKGEKASAEVMDVAIRTMATLNRDASEAMMSVGAHACTDVTGFGLLGHLNGMVAGSRVGARIRAGAVPVLPGVLDLLHQGYVAGGTQRNLSAAQKWTRWHPDVDAETQILLCDAQTSGGLLIALPPDRVDALLGALQARGAEGTVIGEMTRAGETTIDVIP